MYTVAPPLEPRQRAKERDPSRLGTGREEKRAGSEMSSTTNERL